MAGDQALPSRGMEGSKRIGRVHEDERPDANADPYVTTRLIIETVCGSSTSKNGSNRAATSETKRVGGRREKVAS